MVKPSARMTLKVFMVMCCTRQGRVYRRRGCRGEGRGGWRKRGDGNKGEEGGRRGCRKYCKKPYVVCALSNLYNSSMLYSIEKEIRAIISPNFGWKDVL